MPRNKPPNLSIPTQRRRSIKDPMPNIRFFVPSLNPLFFSALIPPRINPNPLLSSPSIIDPMALKAVHVSDVPNLDHVIPSVALSTSASKPAARFAVIGHRGNGMNSPSSSSNSVKENSILSFNLAARFSIPFVEFDVQLTADHHPVIFHDDLILTRDPHSGAVSENRVTDLSLLEFLSYGHQKKPLLRKNKDGTVADWTVDADDSLCTLEEAFRNVDPQLGFNIELKFDDDIIYSDQDLIRTLRVILNTVSDHADDRPIIFSTFQPDAARLVRRMQSLHPVFFLTDGGTEIYGDARRNSLEEAVKLCLACGLQGIVSEVRAVFRNPTVVSVVRGVGLGLFTYGQLNNVSEVVYMQRLMGIDGVIVDRVPEIAQAVSQFVDLDASEEGEEALRELAFPSLLKFMPDLVQH